MIKGAVFDVDGTLLDSMSIWRDAGARYLKGIGIVAEPGLGEILFDMGLEEGAVYMKEKYSLELSEDQIVKGIIDGVRGFYEKEVQLKEGAAEFLKKLYEKKIPMVVATTSDRTYVEAAFERLDILKYFSRIFTCTEVGKNKRQPLIYLKAAEWMGTDSKNTWVFEDVFYAVQTAKDAGFCVGAVFDKESEKDKDKICEKADIYMKNLKDFEGFWEKAFTNGKNRL
ncbi:MAG: HAD family phosphatase [Ruminococcus sp.]|nr:HAD family phosphatase [Ruminococcus sp.]